MAPRNPFPTFLIIGPTCFFLGILFACLPYDYYVLWSLPPLTPPSSLPDLLANDTSTADGLREPYLALLEHHLRFIHASPPLISRILHIAIATGLVGLLSKLYKPTEANMLFDGASLVLYVIGIVVYVSNLVKGMRVVSAGTYGKAGQDMMASRYTGENEAMASLVAEGVVPTDAASRGPRAALPGAEMLGLVEKPAVQVLQREDSLKVLSASNSILALVLVGVLILQAGQWYAQRKEDAEVKEMERRSAKQRRERAANAAASGGAEGDGAAAGGAATGATTTGASTGVSTPATGRSGGGGGGRRRG